MLTRSIRFLSYSALGALGALLFTGCVEQPPMMMEPPQKPEPPAVLGKLDRVIGSWSDTAEMVYPKMGDGPDAPPSTFRGEWKVERALGGMFLRGEGWHEMGENERMNFTEFWTWDPKAKKYRTWMFSDWGDFGSGTVTLTTDGNGTRHKASGVNFEGKAFHGEGSMTFVDDNTIEWEWSEHGAMGKMTFKGTSRRKP